MRNKEIVIIAKRCKDNDGANPSGWRAAVYGSEYGFKPKIVFAKTAKEALILLADLIGK